MPAVESEYVAAAVESFKKKNITEVDTFLNECETYELIQFGYAIEESDLYIYDVVEAIGREDCATSMTVLEALDAIKNGNDKRFYDSFNKMELEEVITFGAYLSRCKLELQKVVDMLKGR